MAGLTKAEKLLVAASKLFTEGQREFTIEDLVVKVHELYPDDFSLRGYQQYPDSNAVFIQVMGKSAPMITRGWLNKTGTKRFRLTPKGLSDLDQLDLAEAGLGRANLDRQKDEALGQLLTSDAFELFKQGKQDKIT